MQLFSFLGVTACNTARLPPRQAGHSLLTSAIAATATTVWKGNNKQQDEGSTAMHTSTDNVLGERH